MRISPSLKVDTKALPRPISNESHICCANFGLLFPAKIFKPYVAMNLYPLQKKYAKKATLS
jgi:hypothetical protein